MTAAVTPGLNHVFAGLNITSAGEQSFYTADVNGTQLIWVAAENTTAGNVTVTFRYYQSATSSTFPIGVLALAANNGEAVTVPGLPLRSGDELRVQSSAASGVTISAIIFENVSGDQG